MPTNQPKWKLLAQLGDRNPIDYGGYFVYEDETGVYAPEGEWLISPDTDEGGQWQVYRFPLDRLERVALDGKELLVPMGFPKRTDLPYPIASYNQWFSKDLDRVAGFIGQTVETLRRWFTEANVCERAYAYSAIGKYHGFDNLDVYPLTFNSRAEVEARYSAVSSA